MISNCLEFGFIMEYLEGGSLDTYIEESFAGITYEQKLSILRQILLGLETLHQNKIIHRDLKPGNILLSKDKSSVKISDFGISIKTNNDSNTKRTFVGTPWYMAPEVIKSEAYSSKADIWSVGCCFYHLLTGKKPYNNAGRYQVMFLMIKKSPLEASSAEIQKMIDAYPEARDFLEKCFLKDKGERPTASELLQLPLFQGLEPLNDSLQILESN
jgi:serine/threonine-protein kinase 24/25/MST4